MSKHGNSLDNDKLHHLYEIRDQMVKSAIYLFLIP
jgi:hypothetical protein